MSMKGEKRMETTVCTVTPVSRPKRKLIYLKATSATDYLTYCNEVGCEWEGLLNSICEKFDTAALIELPDFLQKEGESKIAAGVEVPLDYEKPVPDEYRIVELAECTMLYFQSEPYDNPDDFGQYIGQVFKTVENYDLARNGYQSASDVAPVFNFGATPLLGARIAIPVKVY